MMEAADKYARLISRIVTGDRRRRVIITPLAAFIFFSILTLFILTGLWIDKLFALPHLEGCWKYLVAAILSIPGLLIAGWAVTRFIRSRGTPVPTSPPPKLITTGLYAYVRNPMIIGGIFILEAVGFLLGSLSVIIVFAPLPVLLYVLYIVTIEERELEMRFGEEYREYKRRVPRFIPRLTR
jgi:protein-S-isoprenylcysteine O-methyltransferase Ste14